MMTDRLQVSILAAPLAQIDPRALSQAWYCALRLARDRREAPPDRSRPQPAAVDRRHHGRDRLQMRCRAKPLAHPLHAVCVQALAGGCGDACAGNPQRRPRSPLAQRIERAFGDRTVPPKRATFSMGRGRARVHVVLQTNGERTALLALCRPEVRGVVARALARARIALCARGIGIDPLVSGDRDVLQP